MTARRAARSLATALVRSTVLIGCTMLAVAPAVAKTERAEPVPPRVEPTVVKLMVHANSPNLLFPWQKAGVVTVGGSGVIIDGNRILTNAHVVEDAVNVEVKRAGMSEAFEASVAFVGHECDLAILTVPDPKFFEGVTPLELGDMPSVQDEVHAHGFPIGGETISVTSGIMSRVEVSTYLHSMERLLLAQIDAPINHGNSGGPVVANGSIVGIAVQSLAEGENVGYMIPAPVVRHFLDDLEDGRYDGFPRLGLEYQALESRSHRTSLGMDETRTGVLAARVDHGSPASALARPGDVLIEIEGRPVANDGTVAHETLGRVALGHVYKKKQVGETVALTLLRNGKPVKGAITLTPHQHLIPGRRIQEEPLYLVFGGLLFQPLTFEYLRYFDQIPNDLGNWAGLHNIVTPDRRQVILIQKVLPHPVNRGYQSWEDFVVETVNGVIPRDMDHLAEIIDGADGPWLEIVTEDRSFLTLSLPEARAAQDALLTAFGVPRDRSSGITRGAMTAKVDR